MSLGWWVDRDGKGVGRGERTKVVTSSGRCMIH